MANLYEVNYTMTKGNTDDDYSDGDDEDEGEVQENVYTSFIYAHDFNQAVDLITSLLEVEFGKDGSWEIFEAKIKPNFIDAVAIAEELGMDLHPEWEGTTTECPTCAVQHSVCDHILNFDCSCGYKFKVAEDSKWDVLICPQCYARISRMELNRDKTTGLIIYSKKEVEEKETEIDPENKE
jgi:hypothetical protein